MNDVKTHILVVDDDAALRELLGRYLTEQGFRVSTVADGAAMDRLLAADHARPGDPRSDAAGRGRPGTCTPAAHTQRSADRHALCPRRGGRPYRGTRGGSRRLSVQTVQSARAAGAYPRGAAPPHLQPHRGARARVRHLCLRTLPDGYSDPYAHARRRRGDAHERRVHPAARVPRAPESRALARHPGRADQGL